MPDSIVMTAILSGTVGCLVAMFWKKIGTRFRTDAECLKCDTRAAVDEIRSLVIYLAIKAGVDPKAIAEIAKPSKRPS